MMPFNVTSYVLGYWPFGSKWTCSLQAIYYYCCGYTSIVCLLAISLNRLIGICFSNYYNIVFSKRSIYFEILFTWVFAPALMCPFVFNSGFQWVDKYSLCVFNTMHFTANWMRYMQFTRITFQLVPIFIFIVIYSTIFFTVRGSGMQVIKMSLKSNSGTSTSEDSTAKDDEVLVKPSKGSWRTGKNGERWSIFPKILTRSRSDLSSGARRPKEGVPPSSAVRLVISAPGGESKGDKHLSHGRYITRPLHGIRRGTASDVRNNGTNGVGVQTKMMVNRQNVDYKLLAISVTIVIVFMALFLPSVIVNLLPGSRNFDPRIHSLCSVVTWFNSMVNPIIYCFLNARFRKEYKKIIRFNCCTQ